jgi:hypothetical protein
MEAELGIDRTVLKARRGVQDSHPERIGRDGKSYSVRQRVVERTFAPIIPIQIRKIAGGYPQMRRPYCNVNVVGVKPPAGG